MRTRFTIAECIILVLGVILSITGTVKAVNLSSSFIPYFGFAVLGIVIAVVLFLFRKKRFTFLVGIGMVFVYAVVAGFAYFVCEVSRVRMKHLQFFEGKEVVITIDDRRYIWNGEGFYNSEHLKCVDLREQNAYFSVDGEDKELMFIYMNPDDEDTIYYEISTSIDGEYLVMKRAGL